jgi:hypothetical protein
MVRLVMMEEKEKVALVMLGLLEMVVEMQITVVVEQVEQVASILTVVLTEIGQAKLMVTVI